MWALTVKSSSSLGRKRLLLTISANVTCRFVFVRSKEVNRKSKLKRLASPPSVREDSVPSIIWFDENTELWAESPVNLLLLSMFFPLALPLLQLLGPPPGRAAKSKAARATRVFAGHDFRRSLSPTDSIINCMTPSNLTPVAAAAAAALTRCLGCVRCSEKNASEPDNHKAIVSAGDLGPRWIIQQRRRCAPNPLSLPSVSLGWLLDGFAVGGQPPSAAVWPQNAAATVGIKPLTVRPVTAV